MYSNRTSNGRGTVEEYRHPHAQQSETSKSTLVHSSSRGSPVLKRTDHSNKGKVVRSFTFHNGSSNDSNYSRNSPSSRAQHANYSSSTTNIAPETCLETSRQEVESERKRRKRQQNTESARRVRDRKRKELERMEHLYAINEQRIKELEEIADDLSKELGRNDYFSSVDEQIFDFQKNEERPKWFGAPF